MSQPNKPSLVERLQALRARFAAPFQCEPKSLKAVLKVEAMEDRSLPSTVGGAVWFDTNSNGAQDAGEAVAAGVGVTLTPISGSPVSTTTDAGGSFSFTGIGSGSYAVAVSAPTGYSATGPTGIYVGSADTSFGVGLVGSGVGSASASGTASVGDGGSGSGSASGSGSGSGSGGTSGSGSGSSTGSGSGSSSASVGGLVWFDANPNLAFDCIENTAAGVGVTLTSSGGSVLTTVTDQSGNYVFGAVTPGEYTLTFTAPTGYSFDIPVGGQVGISVGSSAVSVGAGLVDSGSGSGSGSSSGSGTGSGIGSGTGSGTGSSTGTGSGSGSASGTFTPPAVSVTKISDTTEEGNPLGRFQFTRTGDLSQELVVGYTVGGTATEGADYTALSGSVSFAEGVGTAEVIVEARIDGAIEGSESVTVSVNNSEAYSGGGSTASLTIADVPPGVANGTVWLDGNANGAHDAGESVLSGVTVSLLDETGTSAKDADGTTVATVTTGVDGSYSFGNLAPKGYILQFTAPTGYVLDGASNTRREVVLVSSDETTTFDQPVFASTLVSTISGHVIQNVAPWLSDPVLGLSGVSVALLASGVPVTDANGNVVADVTTGADGSYSFEGLLPGSYSVQFTAPTGYLFFGSDQTTLDVAASTPGSNAVANASAYQAASLSGIVWVDANQDGQQGAGESGLSGVSVELLDTEWSVVATTTTATDGSYSLAGLRPGEYIVKFTTPTGYYLDGDSDTLAHSIALESGETASLKAASFSSTQLSSITGRVWVDTDGNGSQDSGEAGLSGVGVSVLSDGVTVGTANSDANGDYSVTGFAPGTYTVQFTAPSGYVLASSRATVWSTEVGTPGSAANVNAAAYQPASVTGAVWIDADSNGVKDSGEVAVDGATVSFYGRDGKVSGMVIADENGAFTASNLPPDVYRVGVEAPASFPLNGTTAAVVLPLTLLSAGNATLLVAYNNAPADDVTITPQAVTGKDLIDAILKDKDSASSKDAQKSFKDRMGVDVTAAADQTKWAKEKLIYGVVMNGATVVSGGAANGVKFKVENFNKAPQKDKAMIIQEFHTEIKLFDADGKQIGKTSDRYGIEGFNVDANGVMNGVDLHSYNSLIGVEVGGKKVAEVKVTTDATIGWGIFEGKAPPQGGIFYLNTKPPEKNPVTWLGKTLDYESKFELKSDGEWFFVDDSTKNRAEGQGNKIIK